MMDDALIFGVVFGMALFWATTTRAISGISCTCLVFACFWAMAAVSEPLTHGQLLLGGLLTWWVPLAPWAVLRLTWTTEAGSNALQSALVASRWAQTERIRLWRLQCWWPMVRLDLSPLGQGRLVFSEDNFAVFGRLTLRSRSFSRAPWFYGERAPDWPAWTHAMRRHRPTDDDGPRWRYWGGSRGRAFVDDRELRHALAGLHQTAILSRPGHLTVAFKWLVGAEVLQGKGLSAFSTKADDILDALERIARRWAELSSGTAVPTA